MIIFLDHHLPKMSVQQLLGCKREKFREYRMAVNFTLHVS
jgi:hypothetical protein